MRKARQRAEVDKLRAELEESRPYLALARELHDDIERLVADPGAGLEALHEVFTRLPRAEQETLARSTFATLSPAEQWSVLERLFDDSVLRSALDAHHQAAHRAALAVRSVATDDLPDGTRITIGLFREADVDLALRRGTAATTTARRLVLTSSGTRLSVLEDVFNPERGLFVSAEYDTSIWQQERLDPHAVVRVGAAIGTALDPHLHPGGRLDVEIDGHIRPGRLHVGYVLIDGHEVRFTSVPV